jgi:hypothetical protein
MPGALERPIVKQVAQRHRKMLVGTYIAQSGDLVAMAHETDRITRRTHALQNGSLRQVAKGGHGLKGRFFVRSNVWETTGCAHF